MRLQELKAVFKDRFNVYPLREVALAPWNYKREDEDKARKLAEKLKRNGQIINITIREYPKDEPHDRQYRYEIIDGNHRVVALRELGYEAAVAYNLGPISKAEAMRLAIEVNEGDFIADTIKLSANIAEILQHWSAEDLALTLPYSIDEIKDLADLPKFDWSQFQETPEQETLEDDASSSSQFQKMVFLVPSEAVPVIQSELDRIIQLCGLEKHQRDLAAGLALERMAANSASVPLQSIS